MSLDTEPWPLTARMSTHERGVLTLAAGAGARSGHIFAGSMSGEVACTLVALPEVEDHPATSALDSRGQMVGRASTADSPPPQVLSREIGCVWAVAAGAEATLGFFSGGADEKISWWQAARPTEADSSEERPFVLAATLDCAEACPAVSKSAASTEPPASEQGDGSVVYALLVVPPPLPRPLLPEEAMSPSRLIAGLGDGSLQLWVCELGAWRCVQRCALHTAAVLCLAAASPETLYCGSADCGLSKVQLSPTGHLTPLKRLEATHEAEVHALALDGPTRLITASADCTVKLWALPSLAPLYSLRSSGRLGEAIAHEGAVYALLLLPGARAGDASTASTPPAPRLFSASADRLIKVWSLQTMDQVATLSGHQSFVCALQASEPRGQLYSASCDKTLGIWSLVTYERLALLRGHAGGLYSLAALQDGRVCSGSLDATVRVWPALGLARK